jgi:NADH-quinone oxidoreductase subunit C
VGLSLKFVKELFGPKILAADHWRGDLWILVDADSLEGVVESLRNHPDLKFDALVDLCGVDHLGETPRFEVVIHLYSMDHNHRVRVRCRVPDGSLTIPSLTRYWSGANWHEREAFDMYGIRFQGHPNLDRILNPQGTTEFPQRKDYPLRGDREPREDEL